VGSARAGWFLRCEPGQVSYGFEGQPRILSSGCSWPRLPESLTLHSDTATGQMPQWCGGSSANDAAVDVVHIGQMT